MNSYEDPFLSETCDLYRALDDQRELIRELVERLTAHVVLKEVDIAVSDNAMSDMEAELLNKAQARLQRDMDLITRARKALGDQ